MRPPRWTLTTVGERARGRGEGRGNGMQVEETVGHVVEGEAWDVMSDALDVHTGEAWRPYGSRTYTY